MLIRYIIFLIELFYIITSFLGADHKEVAAVNDDEGLRIIENASIEIVEPVNWQNNSWGDNDAKFSFLKNGYKSDYCVKTEINRYENGDAKWFFDPAELPAGDYVFSDYYKADVDTKVILAVTTKDNKTKYIDLPVAYPSENWQKYQNTFSMPKYGEKATVFHALCQKGYLITDTYEIKPYEYVGFDEAYVTITFDDGWEENTETALPILKQFGFKTNQFYATSFIKIPRVENPKEILQLFIDDGHEIGSHSVTHPDLTKVTEEEVLYELEESKLFLEDYLGIDVNYFATPYGAYNAAVNEAIMDYYLVHRTAVDFGYNSADNLDLSRLKCMSVLNDTTAQEVAQWVKKAEEENLWLVLLYHRVADDPNKYDTTPENFLEHMQIIDDAEVSVVTISQAVEVIYN